MQYGQRSEYTLRAFIEFAEHLSRYRFRIINMSCALNYMFSIDGHLLQVIEADGVNHNPVVVDSLQIFAGQRYSVVVSTDDKSNTRGADPFCS